MRDWLKKYNVWMKALSLLLAVILWVFVIHTQNTPRDYMVYDVPVQLIGVDQLRSKYNLGIAGDGAPTIDLKLRGTVDYLSRVDRDNIKVWADISNITQAGEYDVACSVSYITGVTAEEVESKTIHLKVEDVITVTVPVKVNILKTAEGFETDRAIVDPISVDVTGIRSEVASASYAVVNILDTLTGTFEGDMDYSITDAEDHELTGASIAKSAPTINVKIPVYMVKKVPLTVSLTPGGGATADDAKVTITPSSVTITGDVSAVGAVTELSLGTINLNTFAKSYSAKLPLSLPDNVYLKDDVSEAAVDIELPGLETAQFNVPDIEVVNMPVGKSVDVETDSVVVTARGPGDKLKDLTADDFHIVVDLGSQAIVGGRQLATAQATLKNDDGSVGVYGTYTVIINTKPLQEGPVVTS